MKTTVVQSWVLIPFLLKWVITLALMVDVGFTDIQSSGYCLPSSFMGGPHFSMCSCLCMAVWKIKSVSGYCACREANMV